MRWRKVVAAAKLELLRILLRVTPALNHAVVAGFPDDEGNSVETVRALARRLPVYWLTGDRPELVQWLVPSDEVEFKVRQLPKNSARAYLAYVTSRYVFFTHGLYGSPPPPRHKTFVNLWHGDGPKLSKRFGHIKSTYVVAGTRLWGAQRPVYFGVRDEGVLVTGNPRIDQFAHPPSDETMQQLGLNPYQPLILWMPTFRRTEYRGHRLAAAWNRVDAQTLSISDAVRDMAEKMATAAGRLGVTFAIKPHHLDADGYEAMGLTVVNGEDLRRAGTTLYRLLGRSHGLVTDYSSVWTDYLALDRPVGFYCPDLDQYEANAGLNVEGYADLLPGRLLASLSDFEQFLLDCIAESAESRQRRARSVGLVGAETRLGASERLLDALAIAKPQSRAGRPPLADRRPETV